MKKTASRILYLSYLAAVLVLADYVLYASYRRKVLPPVLSTHPLSELEKNVGGGPPAGDKKSSFANFTEKKAPGTVRIGCFGDSFTHGEEVNSSGDYPGQLAAIFRKAGYPDVEVLNFGKSYTGFHQTYLTWEILGKKYGLDYVLLGPIGFNGLSLVRDLKFNHTCDRGYLACTLPYLHSRYILKGGGVELKTPPGATEAERVSAYLSFIPSRQNLLYDLEAPVFLRAPIARFAPRKALARNPFYYKLDPVREQVEINRRLLLKLADEAPNVVLINRDQRVVDLCRGLGRKNLLCETAPPSADFPYAAFNGHSSPSGNYLVARRMFGLLTGERAGALPLIKFSGAAPAAAAGVSGKSAPLEEYRDISVEIDKAPLGRFYDTGRNPQEYCAPPDCRPLVDTFRGVKSLLAVKDAFMSLPEAVFIPLDFKLTDLADLTLKIAASGKELAGIELLAPGVNIGVATVRGWKMMKQRQGTFFVYPGAANGPVVVSAGGRPVLTGRPEPGDLDGGRPGLRFAAAKSPFLVLKGDGRELLDPDSLPASGTVYLSLADAHGNRQRLPVAGWRRTSLELASKRTISEPVGRRAPGRP